LAYKQSKARKTIMLRRTSRRVKRGSGHQDMVRLPAVVRLSRSFWGDDCNGTQKASAGAVPIAGAH
jgi:hypothetical protein